MSERKGHERQVWRLIGEGEKRGTEDEKERRGKGGRTVCVLPHCLMYAAV